MESIALFGSFLVIAILGYFFMGKVDKFLDNIQENDNEKQMQTYYLRIAASDFYTVCSISNILSEMQKDYPGLQCTLLVGQDDEVLHCFDMDQADIIIVSSDAEYPRHPCSHIILETHPMKVNESSVTLVPINTDVQPRKMFWKTKSHLLVPEFLKKIRKTDM